MEILVTNDDGVHAAGLAALARALMSWRDEAPPGEDRGVTVVAPLTNFSGASAAVGTVLEREQIPYRRVDLAGASGLRAFGVDGSPALSVIVGALGAFGPRPDAVVSGINLGVNVGRSILHSGTVGAVLTGAQLGMSGLAVSMRSEGEPAWDTAGSLAASVLPHLLAAPPRTVLNLNVPAVALSELKGLRPARIGGAAVIKRVTGVSDDGASAVAVPTGNDPDAEREGHLVLSLGSAVPSPGDVLGDDPADDAQLVGRGFASLTALRGVHEDGDPATQAVVEATVKALSSLW